jgi:tryptophanyl-tRNA synthetase
MKERVLSGMQPSGRLHLGNLLGALQNWVRLQDRYEAYFFVADWHALSTHYADTGEIRRNVTEMAVDWLAAGLDPKRSTLFIQSRVPEHAVLHVLLSMITPVPWLERVPTYKEKQEEIRDRDLTTYGFLGYPVLQSADILIYRAHHVPVGVDQLPHLELTREIARRFNGLYRPIFPEPRPLMTEVPKVLGGDNRKMSKSYGNALYLSDTAHQTEQYAMKMITDPRKIKKGDPGRPDICNVFSFHKMFTPQQEASQINQDCRSGALGCVDCKKRMAKGLNVHLAPMRERRAELSDHPKQVEEILEEGSKTARKEASATLELVKDAMKLY